MDLTGYAAKGLILLQIQWLAYIIACTLTYYNLIVHLEKVIILN